MDKIPNGGESHPESDVVWLRGTQSAEQSLIAKIKDRGHPIEWIDQRHPLWNEWQEHKINAEIDPDTGRIFLRRDVKHIEVLEEFLHNTQEKIGLLKSKHPKLPYPREEIHVKDFMIRHRRMLRISDDDAELLRQRILRYVNDSRVDVDGAPLSLPASAGQPIGGNEVGS